LPAGFRSARVRRPFCQTVAPSDPFEIDFTRRIRGLFPFYRLFACMPPGRLPQERLGKTFPNTLADFPDSPQQTCSAMLKKTRYQYVIMIKFLAHFLLEVLHGFF
jgi:hypothetical protein